MNFRALLSLLFGIALPVFADAEKPAVIAVQPLGSVTAEADPKVRPRKS